MQVHTYVMNRLVLWAIWCINAAVDTGPRPGPGKVRSWWWSMITARNMGRSTAPLPGGQALRVNDADARDMDACVQSLPEELRQTIVLMYLCGGTVDDKAERLGLQRRAFYYRLDRAYVELLGLLNDRAANVTNRLTPLHTAEQNRGTLV